MKKLFFAAFAALVMVSVSNVFANGTQSNINMALPEDTTATDSVAPEDNSVTPEDTAVSADSAAETAMQMFSDTTNVETTTDSTNVA